MQRLPAATFIPIRLREQCTDSAPRIRTENRVAALTRPCLVNERIGERNVVCGRPVRLVTSYRIV